MMTGFRALRILLPILIFGSASIQVSHAQSHGLYAPPLGRGNGYAVATASLVSLPRMGIRSGGMNPASLYSERNEILVEGELWGAISFQSHVRSPKPRPDFASVFYSFHQINHTFSLNYYTHNRVQASAVYPDGELVARTKFSRLDAGYSRRSAHGFIFGVTASWLNGTEATLDAGNPYRLETINRTTGFQVTTGIRTEGDGVQWGAVVASPVIGNLRVGEPVIANIRDYSRFEYQGPWEFRLETSITPGVSSLAFGLAFLPSIGVNMDSDQNEFRHWIGSLGFAFTTPLQEDLELLAGMRYTYSEDGQGRHLLNGIGAEYRVNDELDLVGSAGFIIPIDTSYAAVSDIFSYDLRIGFCFHGQ